MMLSHRLKLSLAWLLCGLPLHAHAVCIGCTMIVTKVVGSDLRFGPVVVITPGTLTLNPQTGARSGTAHVVTPGSLGSSAGPAAFRVTCVGVGSLSYQVAVVSSPASLNTASGVMQIGNFTTFPAASIDRQVTSCLTYSEIVTVGATLTVGASQSPGSYSPASEMTLAVRITANH
ncbi:MAG: hypothetical protein RLZZ296_285 [Pseudomonadota bacterium]|jgi:hypothetical protein